MVILFAVDGYANTLQPPRSVLHRMVGGLRFSRSAGAPSLSPFGVASPCGASADELPAELQRHEKRLAAIEEVKARLEPAQRAADEARGRKPVQDRPPKRGRPGPIFGRAPV